jgi:sodium-coupled neutral amino acid transporter 11
LVDDLGPVLSITGSLGASCIAYIAPGLVYLGVHGGHFLQWVDPESSAMGHKTDDPPGSADCVELPVVGDAAARLSVPSSMPRRRRPCWWWLLGLPLWVALAQRGDRGLREFVRDWDRQHGTPEPLPEAVLVHPRRREFGISIFMMVFGFVAAVCGLLSNIYVQVHDIFFTPH